MGQRAVAKKKKAKSKKTKPAGCSTSGKFFDSEALTCEIKSGAKASHKSLGERLVGFLDKTQIAVGSLRDFVRMPAYVGIFVVAFLLSLYILTMFRDGTSNWAMLWSGLAIGEKFTILGRVAAGMLDNFSSLYGWAIILMSFLQGICIMMLVFAWKHREKNTALDGASTGGIGAVLGFIALGCPSCGVTFVTPILTAIAGAGAAALTETVSSLFMVVAFILLFYTITQLGYVDYVIMSAKRYEEKHGRKRD